MPTRKSTLGGTLVNFTLTGFGGGLDMKRRLLALEGVAFDV